MLSNECQRFKWLKTVQREEDVIVARVIHEFEESIRNKKVTTKQNFKCYLMNVSVS